MAELPEGTVFAGHRIEGIAGRGGMGVVYRATHLALDHVVALKVIAPELADDPRFRDRFVRESRTAVSIRHPNVVQVRHAGEEEGVLFVTMDYVEGSDLRALITAERRIEPIRAARIIGQVADALDAAHERGLVHRDVKPGNVLIEDRDGREHVYLTDFGLTKRMSGATELTATGAFIGTLEYVAPEQIRGGELDARTDVYALGGVAFATVTGEPPFGRVDGDVAKLYAHLNDPPPRASERAPGLSPALDPVLQRAMAKKPDERYPSAGEFARALEAASIESPGEESTAEARASTQPIGLAPAETVAMDEGPPTTVEAESPTRGMQPSATRRRALGALAGLAVVGAIVGAIALAGGDGDDGSQVTEHDAGALPSGVFVDGDRVLVADRGGEQSGNGAVIAIDAESGDEVGREGLGGQIDSVVGGSGALWAANAAENNVARLEPDSLDEVRSITVGDYPRELTVADDGRIWVANRKGNSLSVIDPETNTSETVATGLDFPRALSFGESALWVATRDGGADGTGTVAELNPQSGEIRQFHDVGGGPHGVIEHDGVVWVTATDADQVRRFDADTGETLGPVVVGDEPQGIALGFGSIWVTCVDGDLYRLDPRGGEEDVIELEPNLEGLAIGDDRVWVAGGIGGGLFEVDPGG